MSNFFQKTELRMTTCVRFNRQYLFKTSLSICPLNNEDTSPIEAALCTRNACWNSAGDDFNCVSIVFKLSSSVVSVASARSIAEMQTRMSSLTSSIYFFVVARPLLSRAASTMTESFGSSWANLTAILWPNPRLDPVMKQNVRKLQIFNLSGSILLLYVTNQSINGSITVRTSNFVNNSKLQYGIYTLFQRISINHLRTHQRTCAIKQSKDV